MFKNHGVIERLDPKIDKRNLCRYLKKEYDSINDPNSIFTDPSFVDEYTGCSLTSSVENDIKHGFILLNRFFQEKYEVHDIGEIVEEIIRDEIEDEIIKEIVDIEDEVAIYLISKEDGRYGSTRSLKTKIYLGFNLLFDNTGPYKKEAGSYKKEAGSCYNKERSKYTKMIGDKYLKWIEDIKKSDSGLLIITGEDFVKELGLKCKIDEKTFAGLKKILMDNGIKVRRKYLNNGNGRSLTISMMLLDNKNKGKGDDYN